MIQRFVLLGGTVAALVVLAACATVTPAPTLPPPTATATPTVAPIKIPTPTSDNCVKCHTSKETLEKLAVTKSEKSEETSGEG